MSKLEKAIILATQIHDGQVDLGGHPYMLHPLRVMCSVEKVIRNLDHITDKESILCSAVLHDVIEDYKYNKENIIYEIKESIGELVYKQVDSVTRREGESWRVYINRLKKHMAPRIIKIADLEDNIDITRLKEVTDKDIKRNNMYFSTLTKLKEING